MAIVSGVVCVAEGLARLGFITELLSKPIRYGYMNGIALTVLLSQVPKLFGFSVTAKDPLRQACELDDALHAAGIELYFAEMKDPVKDKLKRFGLFKRLGELTFATLGEAVSAYRTIHPVEWIDWEDRISQCQMWEVSPRGHFRLRAWIETR